MLVFLSELTLPLSERTRTRSSSPSSLLPSSHGDGLCEEGSDQVFVLGTQDLGEVVVSPDRKSANTDVEKEDSDLALEMKDLSLSGEEKDAYPRVLAVFQSDLRRMDGCRGSPAGHRFASRASICISGGSVPDVKTFQLPSGFHV
ncbi:unnamed protein product [Urochloa humidicola]